jgi:hypothetical protein
MDTRPDQPPVLGPEPYTVRLSDPGEIAAGIPHLLGFRPRESVVLVSLTGPGGSRVGLTVRADIPPPAHAAALAAAVTRSVCSDGPAAVLLVVVSEECDEGTAGTDLPHRALVHELVLALAGADVPVRDVVLVRGGRWWSYDCPYPCCAPGGGTQLPDGVTELEVASVAAGVVVEDSRGELAARLAPPAGAGGAPRAACLRVAGERAARARDVGWDVVAEEAWRAIGEIAARCRPSPATAGTRLTDDEIARVVWGLRDTTVRDRALQLSLGAEAAAVEALWTECTRRAPAPLDAAPATLLAVSAWLRGDGAMANVALERALDSDPGYTLARLLASALNACLPPAELRALIGEAGDATVVPRPAG